MAITWADLFGPLYDLVDWDRDMKAELLSARTAQYGWPSSGSAVATPEYKAVEDDGSVFFETLVQNYAAGQESALGVVTSRFLPFAARYMRDNEATLEGVTSDVTSVAQAMIRQMITDSQTIEASTPSYAAVQYDSNNQGDGTATIVVNSDSTLAELPLDGQIVVECLNGTFDVQNDEPWVLYWVGVNPRTGAQDFRRISGVTADFITGETYVDVAAAYYPGVGLSPDARDQIPQKGASIHTGSVVDITTPTYSTAAETSGDLDGVGSNYDPQKKVGTKSNLSRRNTTYAYDGSGPNGTLYLRILKDGSDYHFTWYQDSGLTVVLSNTITLQTSDGTATQTWTAAATNPEVFLPDAFLAEGDNFISAEIAAGSLIQSATIVVEFNLPWATGDRISVAVSNAYGGVYERFFVEELGFALPASGAPTIADPT